MSTINQNRRPAWLPTRREALVIGIGGFVAAVPFARRNPLNVVRRNVLVMGTMAEFVVLHRDPLVANTAIDAAVEALRHVDRTMTKFDQKSDVGRANTGAAAAPVAVSRDTYAVIEEALRWAETTDGAFDPCLGRVSDLWDVTRRHEPPPANEVTRFANRRLYRAVELGKGQGEPLVHFHRHDVGIDLGGIAKGYGVDRAVDTLRAHGVEHALVGAGGDIYALGRSPAGEGWQVGIQSPDDRNAIAQTVVVEDAAVATSGDYEQFFRYRGKRYHHILDSQTGAPRESAQRSATVVAPTCMAADAGATAVFGMDRPSADRVLARFGGQLAYVI